MEKSGQFPMEGKLKGQNQPTQGLTFKVPKPNEKRFYKQISRELFYEPPGVLGNTETEAFIFRENGILERLNITFTANGRQ